MFYIFYVFLVLLRRGYVLQVTNALTVSPELLIGTSLELDEDSAALEDTDPYPPVSKKNDN